MPRAALAADTGVQNISGAAEENPRSAMSARVAAPGQLIPCVMARLPPILANAAAMNAVPSATNSVKTAWARPRLGSCRPGPALTGTMMTRTAVAAMATYRVAPRAASPAGSSSKKVGKPLPPQRREVRKACHQDPL